MMKKVWKCIAIGLSLTGMVMINEPVFGSEISDELVETNEGIESISEEDIFLIEEDICELEDISVAGDVCEEDVVEDNSALEAEELSETATIDLADVGLIEETSEDMFAGETVDPNIMVNGIYTVSTIAEAVQLLDTEYPNTIQLLDNVEGDLSIPSGTEVKLDLNGKRLKTTQITNAGILSIIDSTSGKRGNIYSIPRQEAYLVNNTGTLSMTDISLILAQVYAKQDGSYHYKYQSPSLVDGTLEVQISQSM